MKYAVIAAFIATAQAATDKVCAASAVTIAGFKDTACAAGQEAEAAKVKTLQDELDALVKAANGKCVAVPTKPDWKDATHYKVTCDGTKVSFGYFSDDKCTTAKAPTAGAYKDIVKADCSTKKWDGTTDLSGDVTAMKLTIAATVDASAATFVKAIGAATTLAVVASTLY